MTQQIEINNETYQVGDQIDITAELVEGTGPETHENVTITEVHVPETDFDPIPPLVKFTGWEKTGVAIEDIEFIDYANQ